jgi:circadian clock protein KaiB
MPKNRVSKKSKADSANHKTESKDCKEDKEMTYALRLFVTGSTPRATAAILKVKNFCEENLKGHYTLEVVDIYQQPAFAREAQIIAAPTLIKRLPLPLRRLVGDFSQRERVIAGLDLQKRVRVSHA